MPALSSTEVYVFEPSFTWHGFRYMEVLGAWLAKAEGVVLRTAVDQRTTFRAGSCPRWLALCAHQPKISQRWTKTIL